MWQDEDEADTVGCCSLKVEHVTLIAPNSLQVPFAFLAHTLSTENLHSSCPSSISHPISSMSMSGPIICFKSHTALSWILISWMIWLKAIWIVVSNFLTQCGYLYDSLIFSERTLLGTSTLWRLRKRSTKPLVNSKKVYADLLLNSVPQYFDFPGEAIAEEAWNAVEAF
jgi:hypothetical protein